MAKKKKDHYNYLWRDRKRTVFGLPWTFTTYILTENKFIVRKGWLNLDETEFDLYKVTDKKLKLPFFQRLVGCGTIVIFVRDTDTPEVEIQCIKRPREVMEELDKQIEAQRTKWGTRGRDLYSAMHGGSPHPHHVNDDDDYGDHHDDHHDDYDDNYSGSHH